MKPAEFWAEDAAHDHSDFSCMQTWTVAMFNVAMKFADRYHQAELHRVLMMEQAGSQSSLDS